MRDRLTGWVFGQTAVPYTKDIATERHIDEELPPVEHIEPNTDGEPIDTRHPVERLLQEIADSLKKDAEFHLPTDLTQSQYQLTAAAGVLTIDVARERPYLMVSGDNGVPRNLLISRGLSNAQPICPAPKGSLFLMTYPYTDSLTITFDAGTAFDNLYVTMSSKQINVSTVK